MQSKLFLIALFLSIIATTSWGQRQKYKLLRSESIFFKSGQERVTDNFKKALLAVKTEVQANADAEIFIHAHTDSVGSFESNEKLAKRRAQNVYDYLQDMGVDTSQMDIRAYGEYIPLEDNGTAKGRALNRRVSLQVVVPYEEKPKGIINCKLKGVVKNARTGEPLKTRLICLYLGGKDTVFTGDDGRFEWDLNIETNVEVRANAKGFFFVSKLAKMKNGETQEVNFFLEPALLGEKMAMSDLFFYSGSPELLPSSAKALEGLLAFMQFNDKLKIEIGGHINKPNHPPVSEVSSSYQLSEARAKTVYDYLIEHGISEERLSYEGYGNWQMLYPQAATTVQQRMNRRVELKIID